MEYIGTAFIEKKKYQIYQMMCNVIYNRMEITYIYKRK